MKIAPVSADLLIKLALLAGGVMVAAYVVRKASTAAADAAGAAWGGISDAAGVAYQTATDAAWAVTPWNNQNVISQGVNNALFPDGSDSLGTWLYDLLNPAPSPAMYVPDSPQWNTQGGQWNNPSAYTAPPGQGGAAFGIYPRP